uniref:Uncharacterized protein n=1 Tax=Glossina austeni TaxID=7395 RepID=A0A1A9UHP9_GLOAU
MTVKPIFLPIPPDVRGENFTDRHHIVGWLVGWLVGWYVRLEIDVENHMTSRAEAKHAFGGSILSVSRKFSQKSLGNCKLTSLMTNREFFIQVGHIASGGTLRLGVASASASVVGIAKIGSFRNDLKHPSVWVLAVDQPLLCHPNNSLPLTATAALFSVEVRRIHRLTHINRGNLDVLLFYLATH